MWLITFAGKTALKHFSETDGRSHPPEDIRNNHGWVVFGDFRGAKMWDELQVEGDRRGGVHEPGDARRDPLQLLGALQSVRPRRVSGASATLTLEVHADTNTTHAVF